MDKLTLSRITSRAPASSLTPLAETVSAGRRAEIVRGPEKTLVMLTIREPVRNSRFYLGEALASHCAAELDGARGAAVTLGDDLERASAAALIDAAHTGGFPEFFDIEPRLLALGAELRRADGERAAAIRRTQVSFRVLEDRTL